MKIVMTLCVRNEADMVRENIEFHLNSGVDFIIATDNRSNDATETILREYEQAGLLLYLYAPSPFFMQSNYVTKMARIAYEQYQADWVINNDVDEFWWTPNNNLKDAIKRYCDRQPTDALLVNRVDFVSDQSNESKSLLFYEHMTLRRLESKNVLDKQLPPKMMHRAIPEVNVLNGNHNADGAGIENKVEADDQEIIILHFPLRSYENLVRKATKDYESRRRNILFNACSNTYLEYHRLYKEGLLRQYYDGYCGINDNQNETVVRDFEFMRKMQKIMQAPMVNASSHIEYKLPLMRKFSKGVLATVVLFVETMRFFVDKLWHLIKR